MNKSELDTDAKTALNEDLLIAVDFVKLYYEKLNKKQYDMVTRLFLQDACFIWNGNEIRGCEKIQLFLLKQSSYKFTSLSVDAQKIILPSSNDTGKWIIQVGGVVDKEGGSRRFFQVFQTAAIASKYRILCTNFRYIDSLLE